MKRHSHLNLKQKRLKQKKFFLNILKKPPKFDSSNLVTKNINDSVSKSILKYKNNPSILAIQNYSKNKKFHFGEVKIREIK